MKSVQEYLEILELQDELTSLNEFELKDVVAKLTPEAKTKTLIQNMGKSLNKRDPIKSLQRIQKLLTFLPSMNITKVDSYMKKKSSDYTKFKRTADTVLANSITGVNDTVRNFASSFLALTAFVIPKDSKDSPDQNLKKNIKTFVFKVRKFMDEHEKEQDARFSKEDLPDLAVAWVIVVMTAGLAAGIGTGIVVVASAISAHIVIITAAFFLIAGAVIGAIVRIIKG